MGKINITIGRIITWSASLLLILGSFGGWFGDFFTDNATVFTAWDLGADAGFLAFFTVLIILAAEAVVFFDLFEQKKLAKLISLGTGATALLVFILALALGNGFGYGLLFVLLGGLSMPVGPFFEDFVMGKLINNTAASAPATRFCPNCGAQVAGNAPFCTSCGNKMN